MPLRLFAALCVVLVVLCQIALLWRNFLASLAP